MSEITVIQGSREIQAVADGFNGAFFDRFFRFIQVKPTTLHAYAVAIKNFREYLANNNITAPIHDDVVNWVGELTNGQRKEPTTIRLYVAAVKVFFSFLCNELNVYPNVAIKVKAPKSPRGHKKGFLSAEQCRTIINGIDAKTDAGKRNRAIIALMVSCGLRDIEVNRANLENLTIKDGVNVLEVWGKGRDSADDVVVVPAPAMEAIKDYLNVREEIQDEGGRPLFVSVSPNGSHGRMTTRSISRICKKAMKDAGIDDKRITAHSLRHTFATLSYLNGQSIETIKQACRHANITTTQIYVHEVDASRNTCSGVVSSAIFG